MLLVGEGEAVVCGVGSCSVDELGVVLEADHRCQPARVPGGREDVDESEGTDVVKGRAFPDREGLIQALRTLTPSDQLTVSVA